MKIQFKWFSYTDRIILYRSNYLTTQEQQRIANTSLHFPAKSVSFYLQTSDHSNSKKKKKKDKKQKEKQV